MSDQGKAPKGQKNAEHSAAVEQSDAGVQTPFKTSSTKVDVLSAEALERAFLADDLIPDPAAAFAATVPPVEAAIENADIVLDTNVLLLPYGAGSNSLIEIIKALRSLADKKRLFLPGQVVREFIRNRPIKLGELQQQFLDRTSRFTSIDKINFPILEGDADFAQLNETLSRIAEIKKELIEAGAKVVQKIKSWEWNDPVNDSYKTVFLPGAIVSPSFDRAEMLKELLRRQRLQIPPGYKDASKDDFGIGDLLIWFAVLEVGKANKRPLIFVSGEEKADWQHRSGKAAFLPRYELLDEYRRSSEGQPFYIVPLSKLLELLNVKKESVEQIKHEEVRVQNVQRVSLEQNEQEETLPREMAPTIVECPSCKSEVGCWLGEFIGATSRPRCSSCMTRFFVHRTRNGIVVHQGVRGTSTDARVLPEKGDVVQIESVNCPNCSNDVQAELGLYLNATRWCMCDRCETYFPIHRQIDGGVLVSRKSIS